MSVLLVPKVLTCQYFVGTFGTKVLTKYRQSTDKVPTDTKSTDKYKINDLAEPGWSDVAETIATCSTHEISMQTKYEVRPISARAPGNGKRWISVRFESLSAVWKSYAPLFGLTPPTSGELISELRGRMHKKLVHGTKYSVSTLPKKLFRVPASKPSAPKIGCYYLITDFAETGAGPTWRA